MRCGRSAGARVAAAAARGRRLHCGTNSWWWLATARRRGTGDTLGRILRLEVGVGNKTGKLALAVSDLDDIQCKSFVGLDRQELPQGVEMGPPASPLALLNHPRISDLWHCPYHSPRVVTAPEVGWIAICRSANFLEMERQQLVY